MRQRQAAVKDLVRRAESLPNDHRTLLVGVSGVLELCVSCMSRAMDSCDAAEEVLRDWQLPR